MDIFLRNLNFLGAFLTFDGDGDKLRGSRYDIIVANGNVGFSSDVEVNEVPEDLIKFLASGVNNVVFFIGFD